ncbi:hypothetical protein Ddye_000891 [Dipteronia dyeriana]|uniref:RNase H type-1 domain-containing protein n=1 Tax=Dipteronia dyeriana TaxID=168575 RepID=A0AAD9XMX9_9ROSI|nr:hypothetical protein Ddye_000891 [Dipteronia dyeriana]
MKGCHLSLPWRCISSTGGEGIPSHGAYVPPRAGFLHDFQATDCGFPKARAPKSLSPVWIAPILGSFKINTDAALDMKNNLVGLGVVVRDHQGMLDDPLVSSCFGVISFIPRDSNKGAHQLAKLALSLESDSVWMETVPPCVESFVLDDFPARF